MAVVVVERWNSRSCTVDSDLVSSKVELRYTVLGTRDDAIARQYVEQFVPLVYEDWPTGAFLWLLRYRLEFVGFGDAGMGSPGDSGTWDVVCDYGTTPPRKPEVRDSNGQVYDGSGTPDDNGLVPSFTFDTSGGTAHISQSRRTLATYKAAGTPAPPNWKRAIGVDGSTVHGVDIVTPQFAFTETRHFVADALTLEFRRNLFHLTGKVNDATFRGFPAGEVLFMGASGSRRGLANWELVFKFACSPNVEDLTVGDITGVSRTGWDYQWQFYEKATDANHLLPRLKYVVVEEVYEYGDFSLLQIGVH